MKPEKQFVRVVQHFSKEKQEEFKDMSAEAKLRWLENANKLLYAAYVSSGRTDPYDPQNWPYLS
jgi:hypothetical protein